MFKTQKKFIFEVFILPLSCHPLVSAAWGSDNTSPPLRPCLFPRQSYAFFGSPHNLMLYFVFKFIPSKSEKFLLIYKFWKSQHQLSFQEMY
jgi:hypothetical protein